MTHERSDGFGAATPNRGRHPLDSDDLAGSDHRGLSLFEA